MQVKEGEHEEKESIIELARVYTSARGGKAFFMLFKEECKFGSPAGLVRDPSGLGPAKQLGGIPPTNPHL